MFNNIYSSIFIILLFALLVNKFFWFLPFVLVFPVIATLVLPSPLMFLGILTVLMEFFSTSVPGSMTVAVLLPWLTIKVVTRFYKEVKVDFLISFYLLIGLIILGQLVLFSINEAIGSWLRLAEPGVQLWQAMLTVPWLSAVFTVIASTLVTVTASIFIRFNTSWQ